MRPNTVRQMWAEGKVAIGGWLSIPTSYTAEVMAHQGFDWLCIDTQHGAIDYSVGYHMLLAISTTDTMPFVRVPWSEPSIIMKYLDAGAYGIICPMVSTREQAEILVGACRYPPLGMRSGGPNRVAQYAGPDYLEHANEEVLAIVQIETAQGLDNLDDILSVPGVDVAYIGPSDLSVGLGLGPRVNPDHPKFIEALRFIRECAGRHGVVPGMHTGNAEATRRYISEGFKMINLASDNGSIAANAQLQLSGIKDAVAAANGTAVHA